MMKLKRDMSCYLLNVYTKFQIDISKHVEKTSEKVKPFSATHAHEVNK